MGRQILFHMLPRDCEQFFGAIRKRDAVVAVERVSQSPIIREVREPCLNRHNLILWNRSLLPSLEREYLRRSDRGPYYGVSYALPVLELALSERHQWDGKPALTQGRVYASFDAPNEGLRRWYEWIVRWIRKNFVREKVGLSGGYVGPEALKWYESGGILLPQFNPPLTPEWRKFVDAQHRKP